MNYSKRLKQILVGTVSLSLSVQPVFAQMVFRVPLEPADKAASSDVQAVVNQLQFGPTPLDTEAVQTFEVVNNGTVSALVSSGNVEGAGFYKKDSTCADYLAPGKRCSITVAFLPQEKKDYTGTATVAVEGTLAVSVPLFGTGQPGALTLTPAIIAFQPALQVGEAAEPVIVTVTNTGKARVSALRVSAVNPEGAKDFTQANNCGAALGQGESCLIAVAFTPMATGARQAVLAVESDGTSGTQQVGLSGEGVAASASLSDLDLGNVQVGKTKTANSVLRNTGAGPLRISSWASSKPEFVVDGSECQDRLAAGQSCNVTVTYRPTTAGETSASLVLNAPQLPSLTATLRANAHAPGATLSTPAFSPTSVLQSSTAQATLTNTGVDAIAVAPLTSGAVTGKDFALDSTTCGAQLAAGATCNVVVKFSPSVMGQQTGALTVQTDAGERKATFTALATEVKFAASATEIDFGNVAVSGEGATRTLTLTNTGNLSITSLKATATGAFSITGTSCPAELAPQAQCTVDVRFAPSAAQGYIGEVAVQATNASQPLAIEVSGRGVQGDMGLSTSGLSFSNTQVGESSNAKAVLVLNQGDHPLKVGVPTVTGDYALVGNDCPAQLSPQSSCQLVVVFNPTSIVNPRNGELVIPNDGVTGSKTVSLSGTSVAPQATLSAPSFDPLLAGATSTATATLTNTGIGPLTVTQPKSETVTGTGFSFAGTTCSATLEVGASCTISIEFSPVAGTTYTGTVAIGTNAGNKSVSFSASGTRPVLTVHPSTLPSFGTVQVGQSKLSEVITVSNSGNASALSLKVTPPAGYSLDSNSCGTSLSAGGSCQLTLRFTPSLAQTYGGSLLIEAAPPATSTQLALTGTGAAQAASLTGINFGSLTAGQTALRTATLSNTGVGPLSITSLNASAVTGTTFTFSSTTCGSSLASGQSCTITVSFAPTENQAYEGTLRFSTGAGQVVANLAGTGTRAVLALTPSTVNTFGSVQVGQVKDSATLTLKNTGNAVAQGLNFNIPEGYSVHTNSCGAILAVGDSCSFTVRFAPAQVQPYPGNLAVSAQSSDVAASLTLSGAGVAQSAALSDVSFGPRSAGTQPELSATLSNTGSGPITLTVPSSASVNGNGFSFVSTTCGPTLASNSSCEVLVRFSPSSGAEYAGTLSVVTSAGTKTSSLAGSGLQGEALLSASALTFTNTQVSQLSAPKSVQLTNSGTQALAITAIGASTADFKVAHNCDASLAIGASCIVNVTFNPGATGALKDTLVITHNGAGSASAVALEGVGIGQSATLSSVNFGSVSAGASATQSATLTNTGVGPLSVTVPGASSVTGAGFTFASTNCTAALAAGASCTVGVRFAPTSNADSSGVLKVVTGAGDQTVSLSGTGTRAVLSFVPSTVASFGTVQVNDTKDSATIQLRNTGNAPASSLSLTPPPGYSLQSSTCSSSLAAGAACSFIVRFAPTAAQPYPGNVTATAGVADVSASLALNGTGAAQSAALSALTFGNRAADSATDLSTTLTNTGAGAITLTVPSSASVSGAGFSFVSTTCGSTLGAGASCTVTVRFLPTADGTYSGSLTVSTSAGSKTASLSGQGLQGTGTASPTSLAFGSVQVGQSSAVQTVTLTNTGSQALTFSGISVAIGQTDFGQSNNCGATLAMGASCTVSVSFTPSTSGSRSGLLVALHNGPGGRTDVALSGTGTAPSATLPDVTFGNVSAGSSATQTATLTNTGIGPLSVTPPTAASVSGAGYSFVSTTCGTSLAVGANCTVTLSFAPSSNATSPGSLVIATGAGSLTSTLTGTGTRAVLAFTPSTLPSFGTVQVGQSSDSATLTLRNNGNATASGLLVSPPVGYTLQSNNCATTLAAGSACSFVVRFAPAAAQPYNNNLTASAGSNDVGASLALSGTGAAQSASLSAIDFGSRSAGSSTDLTATLTNTGAGPLSVTVPTSGSVSGAGFSFVSTTCTNSLAVSGACTVTVRFAPSSSGPSSGLLSVSTGAGTKTASLGGQGLQGAVSLSSAGLTFTNTQIGQSSTSVVTLTNSGTQSLSVASIQVETGAADYSATHNCGASLSVNASCAITVTFAPKTAGQLAGSVAIAHNGAGSRSVISLTGTGAAQSGTLSNVAFGNVTVGSTASLTATLTNTGVGPLAITAPTTSSVAGTGFSFTSTTCGVSLASGATCTVTLTYGPSASGSNTGSLTVNTGAGALTSNLSGTGLGAVLTLTPATLPSFGNVQVGQTADSATLVLKNTGTGTATSLAIVPPTGFAVTASTCTTSLAANTTCSFAVRFAPVAAQVYSPNLTVSAASPAVGTSLALSGTGLSQTATLPNLGFGSVTSGQSVTQTATLTNTGVGPLSVTPPTVSSVNGAGFSYSSTTCGTTLGAGLSCTVSVTFAPTANQDYAGTLTLTTGAGTLTSNLTGKGTRAVLALSPASMPVFGNVQVGQSADSSTITLTNTGNASASALALTPGTGYSVIGSTCGTTLGAGSSCTFSLRFAPTAVQAYSTGLSVTAASPAVGANYAGTGTGVAQSATLTNVNFGNVAAGSSTTLTSTLTNTGVGPLSITVPTSSSVSGVGFSFVSTTCGTTLATGQSCTVSARLAAASNTGYNGTLTVATGAGTLTSSLTGTGLQAVLSVTPAIALTFGSVQVGDFVDSAVLTLSNSGNTTATGLSINPPAGYSVQGSTCATSLAAGTNCTFKVRFTPTLAQPYSSSLTVTAAAPSSSASVSVSGTGQNQSAAVGAVIYGNVAYGSAMDKTATLTNSGVGALSLTVPSASSVTGTGFTFVSTNCGPTLSSGGTCNVIVRYSPTDTAAQNGALTLETGAGSLSAALSGTGIGAKATLISGAALNFGSVTYGASAPTASVGFRNDGTSAMTLASLPGAPFRVSTNTCISVQVGSSCSMTFAMDTNSIGTFTATVPVTGGATGAATVSLSGTVNGSLVTPMSSTDYVFDTATYGGVGPTVTVPIRNSGNAPLSITPVLDNTINFELAENTCANVAAAASCTVTFRMKTNAIGLFSGGFSLQGGSTGPRSGTLMGAVQGVISTWGVTSLAFGSVTVGQSTSLTANLTNNGNVTANLQSLANLPPGFSATGCTSVAPAATCVMTITFQPLTASTVSASNVYPSAASVYTNMLTVSGTGVAAGPSVADFSLDYAVVSGIPRSSCNSTDGCAFRLRNISGKELIFTKMEFKGFVGYFQSAMMGSPSPTSLVTNTWDLLNNVYVPGPTNVLIQIGSANINTAYTNTMRARWPSYTPPTVNSYIWLAGTGTSWSSTGYVKVYLESGKVVTVRVNAAGEFTIESVL